MSLNKYKKPLNLNLKPSRLLLFFILIIHLMALSILTMSLEIHRGILLLIGLLLFINLYFTLKTNNSINFRLFIKQIQYLKDMEWRLINSDNQSSNVELQQNWFCLHWLLIMYFKIDDNKNQTIIILPDMINENDLRQLKLHLSLIKS